MTSLPPTGLPDWLIERAALDEVPAASRDRLDRAERRELEHRIAELRDDNAAELAAYPAGPAVAQIEARVAALAETRRARRRRRIGLLGLAATSAAAVVLVVGVVARRADVDEHGALDPTTRPPDEVTRVKGTPRLLAFRQAGEQIEQLQPDALVRAGDVIQLRYNAGGHSHGLIASVDGAGVVTLHFPASEDAPPQATAVSPETTTLPSAYALDDAPRFERFFLLTANAPIDVQQSLAALRALARRSDSATAAVVLPTGIRQASLRLRKPDRPSSHPTSP